MFYLIGVGFKPGDVTLEALEAAKRCKVYFECYTSVYDKSALQKVIKFKELGREEVEGCAFLAEAKKKDVALLVPGDPLVATTHASAIIEARRLRIGTKIIHSASVYSAIAETGLHIYKFGKTTTLPSQAESYKPTSFMDTIRDNQKIGAHTLVLLDVGMDIRTACGMLKGLGNIKVVAAHFGPENTIFYGKLSKVSTLDIEKPCCVVVPAGLHFTEEEFLEFYKV